MTKTTSEIPQWQREWIEGLVKVFIECGASETLARETAWKFADDLSKAYEREMHVKT